MSGLCSAVQLGSTPPTALSTPSPCVRSSGAKRGSGLVSFRSGLTDELSGSSLKGGLSRSFTDGGGSSSYSLSRSYGRAAAGSRTTSADGVAPAAYAGGASSSMAGAARPLQHTASIPKSAAFVKIEGFQTGPSGSPATSAPPSPQQLPSVLSSLLSRQLSSDRLPMLASSPCAALTMGGLADDPALLAARLEATVRVAPVPRPAPLLNRTRSTIPDNLLQSLQVRAFARGHAAGSSCCGQAHAALRQLLGWRPIGVVSHLSPSHLNCPRLVSSHPLQEAHAVFLEPVCVRAFGIARAGHDGRYRASGEPAFTHCVEVARILAELGAGEGTVSGAHQGWRGMPGVAGWV
jgi:hypothetical protein